MPGNINSDFVQQIAKHLREDVEDALHNKETPPSETDIEKCKKLALQIEPCVSLARNLKWAAFADEYGRVSLVLQSLTTNRRLTYGFDDGISAIRIDEKNKSERFEISASDDGALLDLAEWVIN